MPSEVESVPVSEQCALAGKRKRDEDAALVRFTLWTLLAVCVVIGLINLAQGWHQTAVALLVAAAACVVGLALSAARHDLHAALALSGAMVWAIVSSAYFGAGVYDIAVSAFPVFILTGAFAYSPTYLGLALTTSISVAAVFALSALQMAGLIVTPYPFSVLRPLVASVIFIATGILAAFVQRGWQNNSETLEHLLKENDSLFTAEHELTRRLRQKDQTIRDAYVDLIDAATGGKLILVTSDELSESLGQTLLAPQETHSCDLLKPARHELAAFLDSLPQKVRDAEGLVLAFSEALTNACKHGDSAEWAVYKSGSTLQALIRDYGTGIDFKTLPKAALVAGFSTKSTLGMGFTIMMDICDRVLLATDSEVTCLVLEMGLSEPAE